MLNSKFSRRQIFIGSSKVAIGSALLAGMALGPFLAINPRLEAIRLLDEATTAHNVGERRAALPKMEELLNYINNNFVVVDNEQIMTELHTYFMDGSKFDPANCSDTAFPIMLIREGLKNRRLPLVNSLAWAEFAKKYTGIVMAA